MYTLTELLYKHINSILYSSNRTSSALTFNTLSPETKDITDQLLRKCAQYYKVMGISALYLCLNENYMYIATLLHL